MNIQQQQYLNRLDKHGNPSAAGPGLSHYSGMTSLQYKKEILSGSAIEGGHAEIEDDTFLFVYGNAYEIVLANDNFQETIEKIQFQYILHDHIVETSTLSAL